MTLGIFLVVCLWVVTNVITVVLVGLDIGTPEFRLHYANLLEVFLVLITTILCFRTAASIESGNAQRTVWTWIGFSVLVYWIGDLFFAAYPILNGNEETPYPYYSDIGYLAFIPLMIIGLLVLKRGMGLSFPGWGAAVALAALVAASLFSYQMLWYPLEEADDMTSWLVDIGYMIADPILLTMAVATASILAGGLAGRAWWWVVTGLVIYFFRDIAYTVLDAEDAYYSGHPIDITWPLFFGCVSIAALMTSNLYANNRN